MFNKDDIEEYQRITPTDELKERVMATYEKGKEAKNNYSLYKQISLIAACIVIVIVGAVFVRTESAKIKLFANGEIVSDNSVNLYEEYGIGLASARNVSDDVLVINLETTAFFETYIAVSEGEIKVFDDKTNELLSSGSASSVKGRVSIQWVVEKVKVNKAELEVSNAFNEERFEIEYNDETEQKIIKKK